MTTIRIRNRTFPEAESIRFGLNKRNQNEKNTQHQYTVWASCSLFRLRACDNYEEPNPRPSDKSQEPVLAVRRCCRDQDVSADAAYDLKALNDEGKISFSLLSFAAIFTEGYEFLADAESPANGFARSASVPVSVVAANDSVFQLEVNPDDLRRLLCEYLQGT